MHDFFDLIRDLARASAGPALVVLVAFVAALIASIVAGAVVVVSQGLVGPAARHPTNEEAIGRSIAYIVAAAFFVVFALVSGLGGFILHRRRQRRKDGAEE